MKNIGIISILLWVFAYTNAQEPSPLIDKQGKTVQERFLLPKGFQRIEVQENSFAHYLRKLPLKPHGTQVRYFDGAIKSKAGVYCGVIDMEIGKKDLQQCADAVMRLRAEYLFKQKLFQHIHFNFTNGDRADFTKYADGYRASLKGNKVNWVKSANKDDSYANFRKYMDLVFTYAGTLSLSKEMKAVNNIEQIQIGDVFIIGGSPGHAVIVVDMAENLENKDKIFLLAQSYMPAQDIQILLNPQSFTLSPWYSIRFDKELVTPEWTFEKKHLKRF